MAVSTDITRRTNGLTSSELAEVNSWDDVRAVLAQFDTVASAVELGDGTKDVDQSALIGKSFVILSLNFPTGDFGEPYALVKGMTQAGTKFRFSDGSTGICQQLQEWMERRNWEFVPMVVPNGLRASDYDVTDADGNPVLNDKGVQIHATTYYLDTNESTGL